MRPYFLLPLLICLVGTTSLLAQKNEVAIDLRVAPGLDQPSYGASINYYRSISARRSIGGKITLHTDPFEEKEEGVRNRLIITDCVNRWNLSKGARVQFHVEMGISMLLDIKHTLPGAMNGYCGTGLTQSEIDEIEHDYQYGKMEKSISWGPALGTSLDFRVTSRLSVGASAICNWYYIVNEEVILPYFSPALRTAFHF